MVGTPTSSARDEAVEAASAIGATDDPLGEIFTIRLSLASQLSGFSKHILRQHLPIIDGGRKNHRVTYSSLRQFLSSQTIK